MSPGTCSLATATTPPPWTRSRGWAMSPSRWCTRTSAPRRAWLYLAYIERTGGELLERLERAFGEDRPRVRMRWRVGEFLRFVEQHRDGWRVLFNEASASRPVAEEVAQLRRQIHRRRQAPGGGRRRRGDAAGGGQRCGGAGESLANWWLEHPEVPREDVAGWYAGVVEATVRAVLGSP